MKKRQWLVLAAVLAASVALPAQSITVTAPAAGNNWCLGSSHVIAWTKSGAMQPTVAIRLRRVGSPESADAALQIANGESNDGSYSWTVPNTLAAGDYFIRVRTDDSTVIGDSAAFRISSCLQAAPMTTQLQPMALSHRLTSEVTFITHSEYREHLPSGFYSTVAPTPLSVPPTEMLVGYANYLFEFTVPLSRVVRQRYTSWVYRGQPVFNVEPLRVLAGKNVVSATLSFRHKLSDIDPAGQSCLANVKFYTGIIMLTHLSEARPLEPVAYHGTVRIDLTEYIRGWVREITEGPITRPFHFRLVFCGGNETMEANTHKCLSWFEGGQLEIQYRD